MSKYRCKRCNYSSNSMRESIPKICPNCGQTGSLEFEKSAGDLLMEDG